ncbi:FHIPEP family type III secretion protein [Streptomyces rhizosphaericus]|uniref:FHIPEP family type III secretion protein n=1 Tax=Streptomyces rhizosphaericus TaxID=114699 RepID=UPI003CD0BB37
MQDGTAIVLCSPAVRMYIKQLISRHLPDVVVLSYNELEPDVDVESSGVVNLS